MKKMEDYYTLSFNNDNIMHIRHSNFLEWILILLITLATQS